MHPKKLNFNGVKGTGSLAEGFEGRQGLPFYTNTGINATWYKYIKVIKLDHGLLYPRGRGSIASFLIYNYTIAYERPPGSMGTDPLVGGELGRGCEPLRR